MKLALVIQSVSETRALCQSIPATAGGPDSPGGHFGRPQTRPGRCLRGASDVLNLRGPQASPFVRCNPPAFAAASYACLVASAGVRALDLVTERLSPEYLALPVGRSAGRRAVGHVGQFTGRSQIAGDAHGVLHHGEQPHPPLATGADEHVYRKGTLQQFGPGASGIAPHAGLFGTAPDLARFATMLLNGGVFENRRFVAPLTLAQFTTRAHVPDSSRALGWDTPSENSSAGTLMSKRAFGHTGFTGTSMWMDPETGVFVILLTNRVHPTRDNNQIREARPQLADAVMRGLQ